MLENLAQNYGNFWIYQTNIHLFHNFCLQYNHLFRFLKDKNNHLFHLFDNYNLRKRQKNVTLRGL